MKQPPAETKAKTSKKAEDALFSATKNDQKPKETSKKAKSEPIKKVKVATEPKVVKVVKTTEAKTDPVQLKSGIGSRLQFIEATFEPVFAKENDLKDKFAKL